MLLPIMGNLSSPFYNFHYVSFYSLLTVKIQCFLLGKI
ncbi:hypothetical protein GLIP_0868 [Aliiglaciecola lipolytica E3]|uniref:Uncharacterized protein n=1 Tax=Aliiglaciecola lipolytica E3 TaxID=1127673 RepID=K6XPA9_9ALTE|nr:hypothetical protein GLIP_0868 [Aliiglaciecola lipolytica E3]